MARRIANPTPEQKAEWTAIRTAKVAALKGTLDERIGELADPKAWAGMLHGVALFRRRYSFRNTLLIVAQIPGATRVAGYRSWITEGRHVVKGQTGAGILAPLRTAKGKPAESADAAPDAPPAAEPAQEGGPKVKGVRGFGVETVFDISQTEPNDPDAPTAPLPAAPDACAVAEKLWPAIVAQVEAHGYRVILVDGDHIDGGAWGEVDARNLTVRVSEDCDRAGQAIGALRGLALLALGHAESEEAYEEAEVRSVTHIAAAGLQLITEPAAPELFHSIGEVLDGIDSEAIIDAAETVIGAGLDILNAIDPLPARQ